MPLSIEYKQVNIITFKVNDLQKDTLKKLKIKYKINIATFIRQAIKEKIERDYKDLIDKIKVSNCPF